MARKLILAEKPAVARDLARVLGVVARGDGSFQDDRYVITWCIGHLVELAEPAEYNPAWRRWTLPALPMLPARFQLRPSASTARQWRVVRELLQKREFAAVINACDAGREGELIFRYCYELADCRLPIERLWISSLTEQAIAQGFQRLRPGRELEALAAAARCRSEADWLVGMNATRAVTLWRRGEQDVLCSLGRVQTPTLGLLVGREQAIQRFVPRDYFEVHAELRTTKSDGERGSGARFTAVWQSPAPPHAKKGDPSASSSPSSGPGHGGERDLRRLARRELADALVERDRPAPVCVERVDKKAVREPPPLLFDLGSLQRTANRRFGWTAQRTLGLAQALYEEHKLLTYPRTDSRYLSRDLIGQLPRTFAALGATPAYRAFAEQAERAAPPRRVFQDHKVTDHHAIIPTLTAQTPERLAALSSDERALLDLVSRRFLCAFFPDAEFEQTQVVVRVEATAGVPLAELAAGPVEEGFVTVLPPPPDRYHARGRVRTCAGWQEVAGIDEKKASRGTGSAGAHEGDGAADGDGEADDEATVRAYGTYGASAQAMIPLMQRLAGLLLWLAGLILVLDHFGQNVSSVVAALGVTSLAIGLASQQALSNIIAGLVLVLDHPFRVGDRIRLPGLDGGEVLEIGMRSTHIRLSDGSRLIVPNADLVAARLVNQSTDVAVRAEVRLTVPIALPVEELAAFLQQAALAVEPPPLAEQPPRVQLMSVTDKADLALIIWLPREADVPSIEERLRRLALRRIQQLLQQASQPAPPPPPPPAAESPAVTLGAEAPAGGAAPPSSGPGAPASPPRLPTVLDDL